MTFSLKNLYLGLATIWLAVGAIASVELSAINAAMCFTVAASIALLCLGRAATGQFTNLTFVFMMFLVLYGLSGPLEILYGEGSLLGFPGPYLVATYLVIYCLAVIGTTIGLAVSPRCHAAEYSSTPAPWASKDILLLSYFFAICGSAMELTNVIRAGGFAVLLLGKAFAQSAESELTGTLPSAQVIILAASLFGLALGLNRSSRRQSALWMVIGWLLLASPAIATYLILGQRGMLMSGLAVLIVGYYWRVPLRRISPSVLTLAVTFYVLMGALFGARSQLGIGVATGDWSRLEDRIGTSEYWLTSLNPASNEFGAPFGNINTYLLSSRRNLQFGATYMKGLTVPIPRIIWPDKPKLAGYEFRDTFFPELAARGRIAGTAFSSLLEAYMNFSVVGILPVYAAVIILLTWLERIRQRRAESLFYVVFYLGLLPNMIIFHRSALDNPIFWPLVLSFGAVVIFRLLRSVKTTSRTASGAPHPGVVGTFPA